MPTTTTPAPPAAFLSVRLPAAERDRLKAAAAARGETVQDLVGSLVRRFLAEEGRRPPGLAAALGALRARVDALRARGVAALWVFGSVARGDAGPGSDVDLMADLDPGARLSLVGLASLRAELSDLLGAPADLVERAAMRPAVRGAAEREAVRAW
jgi:predicted nucleotidyltransferase